VDAESDAGEQRRPAATGMTRDEYHAKERAAFLAGAGADDATEEVADEAEVEKPKPKKVIGVRTDEDDNAEEEDAEADEDEDVEKPAKAKAKPAVEPEDDADDDDEEDDDEDERDTEDDDDEDDLAAKAKDDPELVKRLAAVRRTEQRHRETMQRERAAFERERSEWQAQSKQVSEAQKRFDGLAARVRYNPTAVLRELGLTDDDFEAVAQHVAAHSKAAGVTPAHRAAAERAMREREAADKAASAEDRVAKLEQTIEQQRAQAEADRVLDTLFGRVFRKADDTTPHVKALIAKNPTKARAELEVTAFELAKKRGALPKSKEVLAAHEKKIARQLRDYGVESAAAKPAAGKKPGTIEKPGDKPVPKPRVEPAGINGATVLPTRVTIPTREEMVAELEALS